MARLAKVGATLAGVVGIVVSACGSSSSGGGASGTGATAPVSQQDFPMQVTSAVCDNIAGCCMAGGFAFDPNGCKTTELLQTGDMTKGAGLDGVNWDANAAGACVALLRQAVVACTATEAMITQIEKTCDGILVGTKPPGAPCTSSAQCAAPAGAKASCPLTDGGGFPAAGGSGPAPQPTCQIVMPPAHGKAGDPCNTTCAGATTNGSSGVCEGVATSGGGSAGSSGSGGSGPAATGTCYVSDGLACDFASSTCKPLAGAGQPCTDPLACSDGTTCSSAGVCAPKPNVGEACQGPGSCATGLYCDFGSQKCAAQKAVGDACQGGGSDPCTNGTCKNGKCTDGEQVASPDICTGKSSTGPAPGGGGSGAGGGTPKG